MTFRAAGIVAGFVVVLLGVAILIGTLSHALFARPLSLVVSGLAGCLWGVGWTSFGLSRLG